MTDNISESEWNALHRLNEDVGSVKVIDEKGKISPLLATGSLDKLLKTYTLAEGSDIDPLTGLGNRAALDNWLSLDEMLRSDQHLATAERRKEHVSPILRGTLVFVDVDGLGEANKRSHEYGDQLLKSVADAVGEMAGRIDDVSFRRGDKSDEMIAALPGASSKDWNALDLKFQDALQRISKGKAFSASLIFGEYGNSTTARARLHQLDEVFSEAKAKAGKGVHIDTIFDKAHD